MFKEMKSHYRLEDLPSRKPHIVEALLYATLVTLVVSRRLSRVVRQARRGTSAGPSTDQTFTPITQVDSISPWRSS